jgi:hypothetical protein
MKKIFRAAFRSGAEANRLFGWYQGDHYENVTSGYAVAVVLGACIVGGIIDRDFCRGVADECDATFLSGFGAGLVAAFNPDYGCAREG